MPTNRDGTAPRNPERTDRDDARVLEWAAAFGVTPDDVRAAIAAVGDDAEAVKEYLHTHHASNGSDH